MIQPVSFAGRYAALLPRVNLSGLSSLSATDQQITAVIGAAAGAIPIAGPFIQAAASIAIAIETVFSGCGQTCVQTSNAANQVAGYLTQLIQQYMASPVRTTSMQQTYLQLFNNAWAQLVQVCSQPSMGQAGQNCISDRQQGSCAYKTSPGGWNQDQTTGAWSYTWPGANGSGSACWNWFVGYYLPVLNDPTVVPDSSVNADGSVTTTSTDPLTGDPVTSTTAPNPAVAAATGSSSSSSSLLPLLLIGGAAAALLMVNG